MSGEILPVSVEQRREDVATARNKIIPTLIAHNHPAEVVLQILHNHATAHATPPPSSQDYLNKIYIALFAGAEPRNIPKDTQGLDELVEEFKSDPDGFMPWGDNYYCGSYRILGCFPPNPRFARHGFQAESHFTAAIPILSRDYQHPESPYYYPPFLNLNKLMGRICGNVDFDLTMASSREEVAHAAARLYFWGNVIAHPFLGGNHRTFDRFLEYAFTKKDYRLETPSNSTVNIPNDDPFKISVYRERKRLLNESAIERKNFSLKTGKDLDEWLQYQHNLDNLLNYALDHGMENVDEATSSLLGWTK